ncbi:MAG TPA: hypothetical protein VHK28_01495 [Candidatus Limnocylindria bacterium]|nr:hypothetical protein [Candidatus Limnocylindria bacterium]
MRALIVLPLILAACTAPGSREGGGEGGDTNGLTACESAMQLAADIDAAQEAHTDLDPAIQQCESIDEFEAAARRFPAALDGIPAREFLLNRCGAEPRVDLELVCAEVAQ